MDATMINAGGIIGSGIFMVPATVALYTASSSLFFMVWILGGAGDDVLEGGAGDDVLSGGSGADTFVFSGGGGNDVVLDFQAGEDMLSISSNINDTGIETADDVAARATQVGANTVIDLGNGDSITLNNVDAEDIQDDPDSFFSVQ